MSTGAHARVDADALRHNLALARAKAPASRALAVVKADGYGHGLTRVARALAAQADGFAVARLAEGLALRAAGFAHPVLLLEGVLDAAELQLAARHHLQVVVHQPGQVELLEGAGLARTVDAWLKIDTGMHRVGFAPQHAGEMHRRLRRCAAVRGTPRLMTHLANADDRDDPLTEQQLNVFRAATAGLAGERSIANSGGLLGWPDSHADWVRPGIMLYGITPYAEGSAEELGLRPAMTLTTRLIAVKRLEKGDAVGYGGTWSCPQDMPLGVAAVGYGDGYPRHAGSGTPVLVNGRRAALAGRVSMDMVTIDLRDQPAAAPGDPVVLWGEGLPVEEVARHAGTIAYELVCQVTQRVVFE